MNIWSNICQLTGGNSNENYSCIKLNGITYYADKANRRIIARLNDTSLTIQCSEANNGTEEYNNWIDLIENNTLGQEYYIEAYEFTNWLRNESGLQNLKYSDAYDTTINDDGDILEDQKLWDSDKKIFDNSMNIENELSNFNEHRLAIIRHKIEVNLSIAIANYNTYSGASTNNVFQMPQLREEEWYSITHNISLMSFLQGLPIGGKTYNGSSLVTNSESKEVVLEQNIYILGKKNGQGQYYKVGDHGLTDGTVTICSGDYANNGNECTSAGRLNLDFERASITTVDLTKTYYYYPLKNNNASYNSIIMQNDVDTYDDIYDYVANSRNSSLKEAFYTALGRERASKYFGTNNIK